MPVSLPPLTAEQVAYLEKASAILVGTAGADLVPEALRAVGVRALGDGHRVEVLLPAAIAQRTLDNLAQHPRAAVTTTSYPTYSSLQVKGRVVAVRDGDADDDARAATFQPRFAAEFAWAGEAITRVAHISTAPCKVLELEIEHIYSEAPAPLDFQTGKPA